jgi:hypothetical protein
VHEDISTWSTNNDRRACVYFMQINNKKQWTYRNCMWKCTCGDAKLLVIKDSPVHETSALCGVQERVEPLGVYDAKLLCCFKSFNRSASRTQVTDYQYHACALSSSIM